MLFAVVQPMYDALDRLVRAVGVGDVGTLNGGYGGVPENAVVAALWDAAHGRRDLDAVVRQFGYHGPLEGEVSGRVWRENPTPLRRLLGDYRAAGPEADPVRREATRRAEPEDNEATRGVQPQPNAAHVNSRSHAKGPSPSELSTSRGTLTRADHETAALAVSRMISRAGIARAQ
jgi:hypothetical protein